MKRFIWRWVAGILALVLLVLALVSATHDSRDDVLYTVTYSQVPGTDTYVMEFTWLGDEPLTITPDGWYMGEGG